MESFFSRWKMWGSVVGILLTVPTVAPFVSKIGTASKVDLSQWATAPREQESTNLESLLPSTPQPQARTKSRRTKRNNEAATLDPLHKIESDKAVSSRIPSHVPRLSEVLRQEKKEDRDATRYSGNARKTKGRTQKARDHRSNEAKDRRSGDSQQPATKGHNAKGVLPWRAGFKTSLRTQGRIKKAFYDKTVGQPISPQQRAKSVLRELLSTPPTQANSANIVAALTYSAKALGNTIVHHFDSEMLSMLFQVFLILDPLLQDRVLTTRQLCNVAWALAKHYDRGSGLLPPPDHPTALSSNFDDGGKETWNVMADVAAPEIDTRLYKQYVVDGIVDEIAAQLTETLAQTNSTIVGSNMDEARKCDPAKIGEICMVSWAFGKLRPRQIPPGWSVPPRSGKVKHEMAAMNTIENTSSLITFEQWGSFGNQHGNGKENVLVVSASQGLAESLFDAVGGALSQSNRLEECSWRELANVGWAFASHGSCKSVDAENALLGLIREARYRLEVRDTSEMKVRDIAQLLWAIGTLQSDNFRLADDLVHLVEALSEHLRLGSRSPTFGKGRPLRNWSCADIVQVVISLAHARIDELPLLKALYDESNYRLLDGFQEHENASRKNFRPWEVSVLLWAQARLYLKNEQGTEFEEFASDAPKFFLKVLKRHGGSLQSIGVGPQEQSNIVWSLTVLEQHQTAEATTLINRIFCEAALSCEERCTIQLEHAHQLWQAYFMLEVESPQAVENVPAWFSDYLKEKWNLEKARDKLSSARHRALSQTLHFMGVDHYNEHTEDIDVAIVLKNGASWTHETDNNDTSPAEKSVAVEFDGPNHFTREVPSVEGKEKIQPRALGHTVLKYRLLKKQGWTVVRIPYFEFDKIPFWASMERQRYVQRKLKTHANIQFSEADVSEYKPLPNNKDSRFD